MSEKHIFSPESDFSMSVLFHSCLFVNSRYLWFQRDWRISYLRFYGAKKKSLKQSKQSKRKQTPVSNFSSAETKNFAQPKKKVQLSECLLGLSRFGEEAVVSYFVPIDQSTPRSRSFNYSLHYLLSTSASPRVLFIAFRSLKVETERTAYRIVSSWFNSRGLTHFLSVKAIVKSTKHPKRGICGRFLKSTLGYRSVENMSAVPRVSKSSKGFGCSPIAGGIVLVGPTWGCCAVYNTLYTQVRKYKSSVKPLRTSARALVRGFTLFRLAKRRAVILQRVSKAAGFAKRCRDRRRLAPSRASLWKIIGKSRGSKHNTTTTTTTLCYTAAAPADAVDPNYALTFTLDTKVRKRPWIFNASGFALFAACFAAIVWSI